jgi:hypothetical protein
MLMPPFKDINVILIGHNLVIVKVKCEITYTSSRSRSHTYVG